MTTTAPLAWEARKSDGASIAEKNGKRFIAYRSGHLMVVRVSDRVELGSLKTATQAGARSIANDMARA